MTVAVIENTAKLTYSELDDRMKQLISDIHSASDIYMTEEGDPDPDSWPHWKHGEFTPENFALAMLDVCREWQVERAEDAGVEPPRQYGRREFGFGLGIYPDVVEEMVQEEANFLKRLAEKWVAVYPECATLGELREMHQRAGRA